MPPLARCGPYCVGGAESNAWVERVAMRALCAWEQSSAAGMLRTCQDKTVTAQPDGARIQEPPSLPSLKSPRRQVTRDAVLE